MGIIFTATCKPFCSPISKVFFCYLMYSESVPSGDEEEDYKEDLSSGSPDF